jgi:hypothetical protein
MLKKTSACKVAASDLFTAQSRADCNLRWAVSIDVTDESEGANGIGGSLLGMDKSTFRMQRSSASQRSSNFPRLFYSKMVKNPLFFLVKSRKLACTCDSLGLETF